MSTRRQVRPKTLLSRGRVALLATALLTTAVLVIGLLGPAGLRTVPASATATTSSAPLAAPAAVPILDWESCEVTPAFECTTAIVPLDHDDPGGPTIELAVLRHLATDPANRIGTLFFNPGGPGESGVGGLSQAWELFPAEVRARFDILSWDPRGVGASTAVECFATDAERQAFLASKVQGFPITATEIAVNEQWDEELGQRCQSRNATLLPHVSTADTARDLDLLRQAVGEPRLNYYGGSYGTYLGAVYANLFPDNVRSMVLDANQDPVAWNETELNTFLRSESDVGAQATLQQFLALCGGATLESCPFSAGTPQATDAKFTTLLERLATAPVTLADKGVVTYAGAVTFLRSLLYKAVPNPVLGERGWWNAATFLEELWDDSGSDAAGPPNPGASAGAAVELPAPQVAAFDQRKSPQFEQFYAIVCAESPNPPPAEYPGLAAFAQSRSEVMGLTWAWISSPCAAWPADAADGYTGPWNRMTDVTALVLNTTYDPATPYSGAVKMVERLAEARLLTVTGYGHGVLGNPSSCAFDFTADYLVDGTLPPEGTVCAQDNAPFVPAPPAPAPAPIAATAPRFTG